MVCSASSGNQLRIDLRPVKASQVGEHIVFSLFGYLGMVSGDFGIKKG